MEAAGLASYFEAVFGPALDALTEPKAAKLQQALTFAGVDDHDRRITASWCHQGYGVEQVVLASRISAG